MPALMTVAAASLLWSVAAEPQFPLLSGRNAVSFADAQYNADFIGMGFVVSHQGRHYGVTAKHVLMVVNHPQIRHVDPGEHLKTWQMTSAGQPALQFGDLLNADASEALDMDVLHRDALVFAVESPGPYTPLKLSAQAPVVGESLYAVGCTFATQSECTQDTYVGQLLETTEHNLLVDLAGVEPGSLRGLSGAPVVNHAGELVGIVSNVIPDADGVPRFAPTNLAYLRRILATLTDRQ